MGKKVKIVVDCDNSISFCDMNLFTSQLGCCLDVEHNPITKIVGPHYTADISVEDDSEEKAAAEKPEELEYLAIYETDNKIKFRNDLSREEFEKLYQDVKNTKSARKFKIKNLGVPNSITLVVSSKLSKM